jgi:hypothetical protein
LPLLGLAVLIVAISPASPAAQEYRVDLTAANVVRFVSEAPVEDFDGVTDRIAREFSPVIGRYLEPAQTEGMEAGFQHHAVAALLAHAAI